MRRGFFLVELQTRRELNHYLPHAAPPGARCEPLL